jgi:hypothetical protein
LLSKSHLPVDLVENSKTMQNNVIDFHLLQQNHVNLKLGLLMDP